jgi:hypothetical protein
MAKTLKTLSPTNRVGPAAAADSAGPPPEGYFASSTEESFLADWREAKAGGAGSESARRRVRASRVCSRRSPCPRAPGTITLSL